MLARAVYRTRMARPLPTEGSVPELGVYYDSGILGGVRRIDAGGFGASRRSATLRPRGALLRNYAPRFVLALHACQYPTS
jgi:hypothetical protein